jgi:hypothetical protein
MIKKVIISGGFHNADNINLNIKNDSISAFQYKRLIKHMCGIKKCICGPQHGWLINGLSRYDFLEMMENAAFENKGLI